MIRLTGAEVNQSLVAVMLAWSLAGCENDCVGVTCEDSFASTKLAVHLGQSLTSGADPWEDASSLIIGTEDDGVEWSLTQGDGFIVIGQPQANRVVFSYLQQGVSSLDPVATWRGDDGGFGSSVATSPYDALGRFDLMVGADQMENGAGVVYLFRDADKLIGKEYSSADVTIVGATSGDHFGVQVCGCGDLTGDGVTDWVISADRLSAPTTGQIGSMEVDIPPLAGGVFLIDGADLEQQSGVVEAMDQARVWWGEEASGFGASINCESDLNDDGLADLIVGAPWDGDQYQGAIFVYFGGQGGGLPPSGLASDVASIAVRGLDSDGWLGYSIAHGDLDQDGVQDLVAGAPGVNEGRGSVQVFLGSKLLGSRAIIPSFTIENRSTRPAGDHVGRFIAVGDLNGQGADDLLIGAPDWLEGGQFDAGRVGIWFGESPTQLSGIFGEDEDLSIWGRQPYQRLGQGALVTDIDGDGADDILLPTQAAE